MIEVNLEHMNFEHRDFVTINKERINKFLDLDGGKVPSRVKGVNFDTIPHLLLNEICNTWEYCVKGGKSFDDFLMYCEDNFSFVELFKDFLRHQRNQISDLDESQSWNLVVKMKFQIYFGTNPTYWITSVYLLSLVHLIYYQNYLFP